MPRTTCILRPWPLLLAIAVLLAAIGAPAAGAGETPASRPSPDRRVLIVASFHFTHQWSQDIIRAIRHKLATDLNGCIIDYLELNAVRNSPDEIDERFQSFLPGIKAGKYDCVIAILDDAIKLLRKHHEAIPQTVPLVVYSNHGIVDQIRAVHANSTGINGQIDLEKNVELGLLVLPDSQEALIIVDPADASADLTRSIQQKTAAFTSCRVRVVNGGSFSYLELLAMTRQLPAKSFVVLGFYRDYSRDGYGSMVDFARNFFAECPRPCLVPTSLSLTNGSLGGSTSKGTNNGETLAEMVLQTIKNGQADKIRIAKEHTNFVIDIAIAKRFNVSIDDLPDNVLLINKTYSLWETNKAEIILLTGIVLSLSALTACLIVISSRSRRNAELSQLNRQLSQAVADAQQAAQAKTMFLATMSHEIRTPLNAVIGFSELLQHDHIPPAQQKEYLQAINVAGVSLLNLINDILDLSKIESNQMYFATARTDFRALCRDIALIFRHRLDETGLALSIRDAADFPWVYVDARRLRQILLNLVGNAVKFTHRGGIIIDCQFSPSDDNRGTLIIKVSDTGIGIPKDNQSKIFEPFVQDESIRGTRAEENSTGLGLPIVKRLIERMGGTLTLNSEKDLGSCFTIELPNVAFSRRQATDHDGDENQASNDKTGTGTVTDTTKGNPPPELSLLLVDDVAMNLKVLAMMAKRLGCQTHSSSSGLKALTMLEEGLRPDIVLTDIWMPGMDGFELARRIRANDDWSSIRLIAISAGSMSDGEAEQCLFDVFLQKPVTLACLRAALFR